MNKKPQRLQPARYRTQTEQELTQITLNPHSLAEKTMERKYQGYRFIIERIRDEWALGDLYRNGVIHHTWILLRDLT